MAIVNDFKALNERCREISSSILGPKKYECARCTDLGWELVPDPRVGWPDCPMPCAACGNMHGQGNPFMQIELERRRFADAEQYANAAPKPNPPGQAKCGQAASPSQSPLRKPKVPIGWSEV